MTPPFRIRLLAMATHYAAAGVKEHGGNNRGKVVDHILRAAGVAPGNPWCAAAVVVWGCEARMKAIGDDTPTAADFLTAKNWLKANYFKPSALVADIENDAKKRGTWKGADWEPQPGDLVIYHFKTGNHIGVVVKDHGSTIETIEGNTGSGNDRDGDGVYHRTRTKVFIAGYVDLGNQ